MATITHTAAPGNDSRTIFILEMVVVAALVLGVIFLLLGDRDDSITIISTVPHDAVAANEEGAMPIAVESLRQ